VSTGRSWSSGNPKEPPSKLPRSKQEREFYRKLREDVQFMQTVLEESLLDIVWPRDTVVSFEVRNGGQTVALDVDLPEIEDLPRKVTTLPARGYKLNVKELK
jgi:hypothetical protein